MASEHIHGEAQITVNRPTVISLKTPSGKISGCEQSLDELLSTMPLGGIYIIGQDTLKDGLFNQEEGKYVVTYTYTDANRCVSRQSVELDVAPKPGVAIQIENKHLCPGEKTTVQLVPSGMPTLNVRYEITKYKRNVEKPTKQTLNKAFTSLKAYSLNAVGLASDDYHVYRIVEISDKFKCLAYPEVSDTVYFHGTPAIEVKARNENDNHWVTDKKEFVISSKERVNIHLLNKERTFPWQVYMRRNEEESQMLNVTTAADTLLQTNVMGTYYFTATNGYCDAKVSDSVVVEVADTGFIRCKVFLGGPYDVATGTMKSQIQTYLPLKDLQHFPETGGREIIDWITLELREGLDSKPWVTQECLLLSDGTVISSSGDEYIGFPISAYTSLLKKNYYIVVYQRNHLPIMSKLAYSLSGKQGSEVAVVDFTKGETLYVNGSGNLSDQMIVLENGICLMVPGDDNDNLLISVFDQVYYLLEQKGREVDYELLFWDLNFDGKIDGWLGEGEWGADLKLIQENRDKYSPVPSNSNK